MSFYYFDIYFSSFESDLSASDIHRQRWNWHLFLRFARDDGAELRRGCQGFSGPLPSAFLDKFDPVYYPDFFKELGANIARLNADCQTFFDQ